MKQTRTLVAISVGLASYFAFRYGAEQLLQRVAPPGPISAWTVLSTPINMLITLLPGFIAGWMCSRGLLAGFVVGLLGSGGYSALAGSASQYFSQGSQSTLLVCLFVAMCIVAGVFSAMAGGSAQLVRSNNSFKPKPLRGSA